MTTRTYYRGPDASVTDAQFVWRRTSFAVRDLRKVGRTRGDIDPLRPLLPYTIGGGLVLGAAAWTTLDSAAGYLFGALAIGLPIAAALASRVTRKPRWELRAIYLNREVVIYSTTDQRVFNQVARALSRSMEAARSPDPRPGFAAA